MTFEELSTKNESQLFEGHPGHYLESLLKSKIHPKKDAHDKEHIEMLTFWGHEDKNPNQLTFRQDESGNYYHDRFWHVALHFVYWKQKDMYKSEVEEFEKLLCNLSEVPLPPFLKVNNLPSY